MKKATIALVLTVLAFAAHTALAQAGFILQADVPMGFSVHGEHHSAGKYELRRLSSGAVLLRNMKTGDGGFVRLQNPERGNSYWNSATPVLRFTVNGERAYLISLTTPEGITWKVPVADKDMEASGKAESQVTVALK